MSTIRVHLGYKLCSVHFESSQFMNAKNRNKLIKYAVPTLFNNNKPSLQDLRTFSSINSEKGEKNKFQYSEDLLEPTVTTVENHSTQLELDGQQTSGSCEMQLINGITDGQLEVMTAFHASESLASGFKRHLLPTANILSVNSNKTCSVGTCTDPQTNENVTCNAVTQTVLNGPCPFFVCRSKFEMFEKKMNEKQKKMRKKIAAQRMRIKRMEITINKLKKIKDQNNDKKLGKLNELSGFAKDLMESQIKLQRREKNGRRYSETVFSWALSVYHCSPSAYINLSKQLCLPSVRSLQKAIQKSNESPLQDDSIADNEQTERVTNKDSSHEPFSNEKPLVTLTKDALVKGNEAHVAPHTAGNKLAHQKISNVAGIEVLSIEENQKPCTIDISKLS